MARLRIYTNKGEKNYVRLRLGFKERLDQRSIKVLIETPLQYLAKPRVLSEYLVQYQVADFVPLRSYISQGVEGPRFLAILNQVVEAMREVGANRLLMGRVLLDIDKVFINATSGKLLFIYQPLMEQATGTNLAEFVLQIVYNTVFLNAGDMVNGLVKFVSSRTPLTVKDLGDYLATQGLAPGESFGGGQHGPGDADGFTTLIDQSDATTLLEEDMGTTLLEAEPAPTYPWLQPLPEGSAIYVNKPVFRIGKQKDYVDYWIEDNTNVSRSHADIITENGRYYVYDNNSTNKTFVNNTAIPVQQKTEIFDGNLLKFANLEFRFNV